MKVIQQVSFAGIDAIRDVEIPDPKLSPMTALVAVSYTHLTLPTNSLV